MNSLLLTLLSVITFLTPQYHSAAISPPAFIDTTVYTAQFTLGYGGEPVTLSKGDTIGEWEMENLKIQYFSGNYNGDMARSCEAVFYGNVTIEGTISPSLLIENAYDFCVDKEFEEKLPFYINPALEYKENYYVMLALPDDVSFEQFSAMHENSRCRLTVKEFHFIFAYMSIPSTFVVESVEIID